MNLAIVGAAGGTGRLVVEQALQAGHDVTAVVRDPTRFTLRHPRLAVARADVLDAAAVEAAIAQRHDAVLSALGVPATTRGPVVAISQGTRNVIAAMERAGARRLVVLSAAGMHADAKDPLLLRFVVKPILQRAFHAAYADMARMEAIVKPSRVDWTIVLPTRLTNGPSSPYRIAVDENVRWALQVSRANVATCMLDAVRRPGWIGHSVNVAD